MPGQRVKIEDHEVELTNLQKVFYPATGFTKGQVLDYYRRVAPWLLPHLRGRPLVLKRYPNGVDGKFFFEKRCPQFRPDWMPTVTVGGGEHMTVEHCTITDLPSLMWVVNLAAIEMHVLLVRAGALDRPTMVVFDLDPGPPATLLECAKVALTLRDLLQGIKLEAFAKVSGSKGLHLYIPVNTPVTFEQTKYFAQTVARTMEKNLPDQVTSNMRKDLRAGKIFIDWSQNDSHKSTVCVYSLRARQRPWVSTPVTWDELRQAVSAKSTKKLVFEPEQVLARLEKEGDCFEKVLTLRQRLPGIGKTPEEGELAVWTSAGPPARGAAAKRESSEKPAAAITEYRRKRDFARTREPSGESEGSGGAGAKVPKDLRSTFVVQKHNASHLHYDFRLEADGVLKSWAVPKGPSLNPADKRLAVRTEDHPLEYAAFEGVIPEGEYGGGQVIVWDRGPYHPIRKSGQDQDISVSRAIDKGRLEFWLDGTKLHGGFLLVRMRPSKSGKEQWLLRKLNDEAADPHADPTRTEPNSVLSGRSVEELAERKSEAAKPRGRRSRSQSPAPRASSRGTRSGASRK